MATVHVFYCYTFEKYTIFLINLPLGVELDIF